MIDFRSDLLSRPTAGIVAAMTKAMSRPAVFGLREDADQRAVEELAADLLGHEDALLFPTCTMANQTALALIAAAGTCVVTQSDPHVLTSEAGASAALFGITLQALPGGAEPRLDDWSAAAARVGDELRMPVSALVIENTHNRGGGVPLAGEYVDAVLAIGRRHGLGAHLDGARLPNAAAATGQTLARLAGGFDTVSMSLNKGLCAPVGAVLAGSRALIREALVVRQRLGGGIRPTAIPAAAGLAALRDMTGIARDHQRALRLARALADLRSARVDPMPRTNIVVLRLEDAGDGAGAFCRALDARGVRALPFGPSSVRFATYHGIDDEDIDRAAATIAETVEEMRKGRLVGA